MECPCLLMDYLKISDGSWISLVVAVCMDGEDFSLPVDILTSAASVNWCLLFYND